MKFVKTEKWWRLRGQMGPNNERCKIDTLVEGKERVFFVPETEDEKNFFDMDLMLGYSGIPYGPSGTDPSYETWGWRFYPDRTEEDMKKFAESVASSMKHMVEDGVAAATGKDTKKNVLN